MIYLVTVSECINPTLIVLPPEFKLLALPTRIQQQTLIEVTLHREVELAVQVALYEALVQEYLAWYGGLCLSNSL